MRMHFQNVSLVLVLSAKGLSLKRGGPVQNVMV